MPFVSFNWRNGYFKNSEAFYYFLVLVDIDIARKNFQGIMFLDVKFWLCNLHLGVF